MKVPMEEDGGREDGGVVVTTAQVLDEDVKNFVSDRVPGNFLVNDKIVG